MTTVEVPFFTVSDNLKVRRGNLDMELILLIVFLDIYTIPNGRNVMMYHKLESSTELHI